MSTKSLRTYHLECFHAVTFFSIASGRDIIEVDDNSREKVFKNTDETFGKCPTIDSTNIVMTVFSRSFCFDGYAVFAVFGFQVNNIFLEPDFR